MLTNIFVETVIHFIFQDFLMNRKLKEQHLLEIEIFKNTKYYIYLNDP